MAVTLNVIFGMGGIAGFTIASWYGPVAVVMPIVTASKLLFNMATQISFKLSEYDKSMRVGTWILCCATACLPQAGPTEPDTAPDAAEMLSTVNAQVWIGFLVLALGACLIDYHWFKDIKGRTLFTLSANVAISTALGANVAKYLGVAVGEERPICFFFGFILAFLSFAYTYMAALECDLSVYIPMSESVQLVVNAFTGMIIWGDLQRIPSLLNYTMVYALIILGVYELSTHDLFGFTVLIKGNRMSKQAVLSYTKLLMETKSEDQVRKDIPATHLLEALADLVSQSIDKGELTSTELVEMIKKYQNLRKVEGAATKFQGAGQDRVRRETTARNLGSKWKERSKTSQLERSITPVGDPETPQSPRQALAEPLLGSGQGKS